MERPLSEEFSDVYDEEVWRVYGYFAYRLRSRSDAEDLTQLTFERALKAWDRFDPSRAEVVDVAACDRAERSYRPPSALAPPARPEPFRRVGARE